MNQPVLKFALALYCGRFHVLLAKKKKRKKLQLDDPLVKTSKVCLLFFFFKANTDQNCFEHIWPITV